jgi:hypothetical protein
MAKKVLPPTFKDLITADEVKCNYGFVYMVKVEINGQNRLYIGQKCFHDTKHPWQTYTTSSKIVKSMIKAGVPVTYAVIGLCKTKQALNAEESKYIVSTWKKLADVGKLYLSLNFAVSKAKRDRVLRGIGVNLRIANCSIQKEYIKTIQGDN